MNGRVGLSWVLARVLVLASAATVGTCSVKLHRTVSPSVVSSFTASIAAASSVVPSLRSVGSFNTTAAPAYFDFPVDGMTKNSIHICSNGAALFGLPEELSPLPVRMHCPLTAPVTSLFVLGDPFVGFSSLSYTFDEYESCPVSALGSSVWSLSPVLPCAFLRLRATVQLWDVAATAILFRNGDVLLYYSIKDLPRGVNLWIPITVGFSGVGDEEPYSQLYSCTSVSSAYLFDGALLYFQETQDGSSLGKNQQCSASWQCGFGKECVRGNCTPSATWSLIAAAADTTEALAGVLECTCSLRPSCCTDSWSTQCLADFTSEQCQPSKYCPDQSLGCARCNQTTSSCVQCRKGFTGASCNECEHTGTYFMEYPHCGSCVQQGAVYPNCIATASNLAGECGSSACLACLGPDICSACARGFAEAASGCNECAEGFTSYPHCDRCVHSGTNYAPFPDCSSCAVGFSDYPRCVPTWSISDDSSTPAINGTPAKKPSKQLLIIIIAGGGATVAVGAAAVVSVGVILARRNKRMLDKAVEMVAVGITE